MKTFDFAVTVLVAFGLFIFSSAGQLYAQSSPDIKKSDVAEHAQLPTEVTHETASESETKNISSTTRQTPSPVRLEKARDSPSNEDSAHPDNNSVSGASRDSLKPADCCAAHTCCP